METFFLASFIGVLWPFTVYLGYHLGANFNQRANDRESRERMKTLYGEQQSPYG